MSADQKVELILDFQTGKFKGQRARIRSNRIVIGRAAVCDIQLDEEGVSRQHALITFQQNKYFIEDLHTENGILVNNKRIQGPHVLYHKDLVRCGQAEFRVLIPGTVRPSQKLMYESEKLDLPTDLGAEASAGVGGGLFKNKRVMIYGGGGLVLVVLVVLMMGTGEETANQTPAGADKSQIVDSEASPTPGNVQTLQKEIEEKQKTMAELMQKEAQLEKEKVEGQVLENKNEDPAEDSKIQMARAKFRSGIKELMAQSYVQSEKEFNLSLALNPNDLLVSEYLMRVRRKRRAVADENYQLGKNYFSSLQYDLAMGHFRKVINLLEIEKQNLDHESKGYVATLENAQSYLDRSQKALESGENR